MTISKLSYNRAIAQLAQHAGVDVDDVTRIECHPRNYAISVLKRGNDGKWTGDTVTHHIHVFDPAEETT